MVSVAVSKVVVNTLFFMDSAVKVNGKYYRHVLLSEPRAGSGVL